MFIQTEATPNPATLKFIPGRIVLDNGTLEFANREAASRSPLAERLFSVPGVTSVFYGSDFVTVTKDDSDWQHLKPAILGAIMEHYMSGAPLLADGSQASDADRNSATANSSRQANVHNMLKGDGNLCLVARTIGCTETAIQAPWAYDFQRGAEESKNLK